MQDPVDLRTLFWRTAPIIVRRSERDESSVELNVRVLAGYSNGSEALKLVRIYISNDVDSSFLYSLDILEQHYCRVREEEQLLVDFAGFAEKVAWLLHQCCSSTIGNNIKNDGEKNHTHEESTMSQPPPQISMQTPSGPPTGKASSGNCCKFRAILNVSGAGAGLLRLVESNTFKDLAHLSLQLRAGTDSSIKQFLAFRLGEVKADCNRLTTSLHEMHAAKNALEAELASCQKAALEASQESQARLHQANTEISSLQVRLNTAETSITALNEQLTSALAQLATARDRASTAEEQISHLQHTKSELEVELSERLSQLQGATTRAEISEVSAAQVAQRCQGFEAALQQAETRIDEWKGIASRHENRAAAAAEEAASLRERCAAAAQENTALQKQLQEKSEIASETDSRASKLEEKALLAEKKAAEMKEKLESVQISAGDVQTAAAKAAKELEEARNKIEANDKMIAWLNKQLTAAQLQASTVAKPRIQTTILPGSNNINTILKQSQPLSSNGGGVHTTTTTAAPATVPIPTPGLNHLKHSKFVKTTTTTTSPLGSAAPMPLTPEHSIHQADLPKPQPPLFHKN